MTSTGCSHCPLNAALDVLNRLFPLSAKRDSGCPQPAAPHLGLRRSPFQLHRAFAAQESSASRFPPRRRRERGREMSYRTRSASPTRAEPSRRRYRSRSPPTFNEPPPRWQVERRPREDSRRPRKDKGEFFQSGADPRGGVCAACLGRREHPFIRCEGRKLWDGSNSASRKDESGTLVSTDGLPICYNWQLPRGCQSAMHSNRHRCSGCGKTGHGAQACPRAEKA
jgi:hypothetical protein